MEHLKDTEKFIAYKKKINVLEDIKDSDIKDVEENLSLYISKLVSWIERMIFNRISKRVNFILKRVQDNRIELIAPGNNDKGQDNNWAIEIDSNFDLIVEKRVSGTWDTVWKFRGS